MREIELLRVWFSEAYGVGKEERWTYIDRQPYWTLLQAILESLLFHNTAGEKPEKKDRDIIGLSYEEARRVGDHLHVVYPLFVEAIKGDKEARLRVEAIFQIANKSAFKRGRQELEEFLLVKGANASRDRAFSIRRLMGVISQYVQPKWADEASILNGTVLLRGSSNGSPVIREELSKLLKGNSTLESLAIELYRKRLKEEHGTSITVRRLREDLNCYRDWRPELGEATWVVQVYTYDLAGKNVKTEELRIGYSSDAWIREHKIRRHHQTKNEARKKKSKKNPSNARA